MKVKRIISERVYKAGYIVRREIWNHAEHDTEMRVPYTFGGDYLGSLKTARYLIVKRGIYPIKSKSQHCVCSIGFCPKERKWYGWSHRAICGFGIGDRIYEENYGNDNTPFIKHGRKAIKNLQDARQAAEGFAESVS